MRPDQHAAIFLLISILNSLFFYLSFFCECISMYVCVCMYVFMICRPTCDSAERDGTEKMGGGKISWAGTHFLNVKGLTTPTSPLRSLFMFSVLSGPPRELSRPLPNVTHRPLGLKQSMLLLQGCVYNELCNLSHTRTRTHTHLWCVFVTRNYTSPFG